MAESLAGEAEHSKDKKKEEKKSKLQKLVPGHVCGTSMHWSDASPNFLQPQNGDMKIIREKENTVFSGLSLDQR